MADILLVDDDLELAQSLLRVVAPLLAPRKISVAGNALKALELAGREKPLVAVIDLCLDELAGVASGFELLRQLRLHASYMRVLVLTGHGSISNGIKAMQLGAASFLEKPADPEHLAALIRDALVQAELRMEYEKLARDGGLGLARDLCGESQAIVKLRADISFASQTSQPVLLLGETGTGKSLCARLIHEYSARRSKKFVHYHPNFGGGDIVQSELFGHTKGAFTGAVESRRGLALEADEGTLLIDELDAVPRDTQVLLLDLVQEQRIRPVGSDRSERVNCRFIAATNRPIDVALAEGLVRHDLHHRLAHNIISIPPLRSRLEDLSPLIARILDSIRQREGLNVFEIDPALIKELHSYDWPGNIRELQGVVETGAYRAHFNGRSVIESRDLSLGEPRLSNNAQTALGDSNNLPNENSQLVSFHEQVAGFKRKLVKQALEESAGNQAQAALLLGVDRGTVRRLSC
jgi:DNA-binding NtrC family response regulator